MAVGKLQRWAIILSAYTYEIQYKATKEHGNADTLSRFPLSQDGHFENEQSLELVVNQIQCNQLENLPISSKEIEAATKTDSIHYCRYVNTSEMVGQLTNVMFQKPYNHIFRTDLN